MNFHITRNTADHLDKPKIVIAVVNKLSLEKALPQLSKNLFSTLFEPLTIPRFCKQPKCGYQPPLDFVSLTRFEDSKEANILYKEIRMTFSQSSKLERNGRRLRVNSDLDAN